jgi:archaellum component FlaF (FlaF/FlaG flagellin family)
MSKKSTRKTKSSNNILKIIIVILAIVIIGYLLIVNFGKKDSNDINKEGQEKVSNQCLTIKLTIESLEEVTNLMKISRGIGEENLSKIKVLINGKAITDLVANDLKESSSKIFLVPLNSGDKVEISPVLKDGTICPTSDTKTA